MKKAVVLLAALLLVIAMGYKIAHASSPTQANSEIQVTAVNAGLNENGDTVFKIYFTFDLDKKPILSSRHRVQVKWQEGWEIESYHIMRDGKYSREEVAILPLNSSMDIPIDAKHHIDEKGRGQGYVVLTSRDKKVICQRINSKVSIGFHYQSAVTDFKLVDSAAWNNEAAVGFH